VSSRIRRDSLEAAQGQGHLWCLSSHQKRVAADAGSIAAAPALSRSLDEPALRQVRRGVVSGVVSLRPPTTLSIASSGKSALAVRTSPMDSSARRSVTPASLPAALTVRLAACHLSNWHTKRLSARSTDKAARLTGYEVALACSLRQSRWRRHSLAVSRLEAVIVRGPTLAWQPQQSSLPYSPEDSAYLCCGLEALGPSTSAQSSFFLSCGHRTSRGRLPSWHWGLRRTTRGTRVAFSGPTSVSSGYFVRPAWRWASRRCSGSSWSPFNIALWQMRVPRATRPRHPESHHRLVSPNRTGRMSRWKRHAALTARTRRPSSGMSKTRGLWCRIRLDAGHARDTARAWHGGFRESSRIVGLLRPGFQPVFKRNLRNGRSQELSATGSSPVPPIWTRVAMRESAWLRGSGVPGVPEMLAACVPRCVPGDRLPAVRVYAVVSEQMSDEALALETSPN